MNDIDLIPENYRIHIWKIRILKLFAILLCALVITIGVAYGALEYVKHETNYEITRLFKVKEITSKQRKDLQILRTEKKELDYQWALLSGLRSAVAPEDLFIAIDKSIQDIDVWFTSMKFERAEAEIEEEDNLINRGYFIIVTPGDDNESWAIGTKLLITGEVSNHSTLSLFVKNLLDQREILDAKVIETSLRNSRDNRLVRFNLSITVNLDRKLS